MSLSGETEIYGTLAKIKKTMALFNGATSRGERDASRCALLRLQERLLNQRQSIRKNTMKINPKTEADISQGLLLPAGEYDFEILEAQEKVSKSGNEMIAVKLAAFRPNGSRQYVNDWLMEKVAFKLRHFCYAVGLGDKYEAGAISAEDCKGRSGRVILKIEERDGFPPQNVVKDYAVPATGKSAKPEPAAAKASAAAGADEPPF